MLTKTTSTVYAGMLAVGALAMLASGCRGEAEAQPAKAGAPSTTSAPSSKVAVPAAPAAPAAEAPKLAVPASWRPMPEAVHAVEESLAAAKMAGAQVLAWGDPARGCYAIQVIGKEKGRHVAQMEAGLRKGFGAPPKVVLKEGGSGGEGSAGGKSGSGSAAANPSSAEITLTLEKPLPGGLRARLRDDGESTRLAAAACFYHARYPEQCRRHCERALASLEAP